MSSIARQLREVERQRRAQERAQREAERTLARQKRERARAYAETRADEAAEQTKDLERQLNDLANILAHTLDIDDFIDLETIKQKLEVPKFRPGALAVAETPPALESFLPLKPGFIARLIPGASEKYKRQVADATEKFNQACQQHAEREQKRLAELDAAKVKHAHRIEDLKKKVAEQHEEVDSLKRNFENGDPIAVVQYFDLVLETSSYPEGFSKKRKLALVPESKQLVVEYDFPLANVVPENESYRYVKAKDEIVGKALPSSKRRELYASILAQVALRTLHELFESDRSGKIETIVFNGYVDSIDKGTGLPVRPCLITVRTTRAAFERLDLRHVEPNACLKTLSASVSKSPAELAPVRPVLEFNMVDSRFVEETDILSGLDQRPNLMELTPTEFESLITNLFEKMGLETRLTQASRDGGVDCVAYDPRPIFGGKVVIQAKRYKNTVGVSAVRDLFGTMQNEGASKGILVTTSGYGDASFEFAKNKPIELLSGSNLLFLLAEHAGIEAKIEAPEDWKDPVPDS